MNIIKKLLVTSTDLMMVQFLLPHIKNLSENGYEIDVACSDVGGRIDETRDKLGESINNFYKLSLQRSPLSFKNFKGYTELKKITNSNDYDLIWTNEPVMGVVTRLAAKQSRKCGTKVIYMVHGFHFFKGAPKLNWIVYYPIEKKMAKHCDIIATINREDYEAADSFKPGCARYIHGIGVNTERLNIKEEQSNIRQELNLSEKDFIVLSVGELNSNKNHRVVIDALRINDNDRIHYVICGKGAELENLKTLANEYALENNIHFLGYRTDVVDICSQSDLFAFPSFREGLGLAALEAMYCGLPLVTTNSRGPVDFMKNGVTGYICDPNSADEFAEAMSRIFEDKELQKEMGINNKNFVKPFCIENVKQEVLELLNSTIEE